MTTPEEIIYDAGRAALAEQEAFVAGLRQRTSSLLAAQALVASFLGSAALRADGLSGWSRPATVALVLGLVLAAVVLTPWRMRFAVDAGELHACLCTGAIEDEAAALVAAGFFYQDARRKNVHREAFMSRLSSALGVVTVAQTLFWLLALGLD